MAEQIQAGVCEVCKKAVDISQAFWKQEGEYFLCAKCDNRLRVRQAEQNAAREKKLDFPASVNLDREELLFVKSCKLLPTKAYVYFALRIDYGEESKMVQLNIKDFCDRWKITQYDLMGVIATLGKKGFISVSGGSISLQVRDKKHILSGLEELL